ncbi:hypothetical protein INS49_006410 [Diaporthe citri]|uniref:uncharacterized protein n=1 Tax=Diaporthe citri TaxID=83186 RepID=UPI001C7F679C|nr:uncharacterized protein INS49_006410 [Diaporthe citri]KAG6364806.1 hypothetical protein INS49_006410 [Diaporthe citri]
MGDIDNDHIGTYIKDAINNVIENTSIESKSASDEKVYDVLSILCVRDESGNPMAANLEKLRSNLEMIQDLADDETQPLEFVRSDRTWLAPPSPEMDEGAVRLRVLLDPSDASVDDARNDLRTIRGFIDRCNMGDADFGVKITINDGDKTHNAEANA